jgi:DNA (cytosine-5)-methyltransferase 1
MTLTVGSLFSGIGGFDLGLERAGMKVIWQSEIDHFACKVLKKHWPDVPNLGDITKVDWTNIERPDVICGGYPCQPFSTAGKRGGATDPRHLWPAMFNAICLLRPRYALMENVRGHLSMGFGDVLADLASIGYDAEWQVIPAAAIGAPHKRDRVFIVAYANNTGNRTPKCRIDDNGSSEVKKRSNVAQSQSCRLGANVANSDGKQLGQRRRTKDIGSKNKVWSNNNRRETTNGFGQWWEVEPNVGRVANGVSDRVDRLKGLGNAIVPQVAELVGRLIMDHAQ